MRRSFRITLGFFTAWIASVTLSLAAVAQEEPLQFVLKTGEPVAGYLLEINSTDCILQLPGSQNDARRLPHREVQNIVRSNAISESAIASARSGYLVQLVDGSRFYLNQILIQDRQLIVAADAAGIQRLTVDTRDIAFVDLTGKSMIESESWNSICNSEDQVADRLIVTREHGLDYVEGIVGDVAAETVTFRVDDQTIDANRERIDGIAFYHAAGREMPEPVAQLETLWGTFPISNLVPNAVAADPQAPIVCRFETTSSAIMECLISELISIDFASGRETYLSDLEPSTYEWWPLIGDGRLLKFQRQLNTPCRDQSFSGQPLSLEFARPFPLDMSKERVAYQKGLAIKGGTRLVYGLDGSFQMLSGWIGFDPAAINDGAVDIVILGDGQELLRQTLRKREDEPMQLSLPISSVRRLTLQVDYSDDRNVGDIVHACELKVSK